MREKTYTAVAFVSLFFNKPNLIERNCPFPLSKVIHIGFGSFTIQIPNSLQYESLLLTTCIHKHWSQKCVLPVELTAEAVSPVH
jgi:hypothetical protein